MGKKVCSTNDAGTIGYTCGTKDEPQCLPHSQCKI